MEFKRIDGGHSIQQDLMAINPSNNRQNCGNCAVAYAMRRQGFDVEAKEGEERKKMTLRKAYVKAKDHAKAQGRTRFTSCNDYGDFWGFGFMSPNYALNLPPEKAPNGGGYITVDKKTGKIGFFIPPMDLDLFRKRKPVPFEQLGVDISK